MNTRLLSLNGAVALSVIALLAVLARFTFLDALFVAEFRSGFSEDQPGPIAQSMLVYMALFGTWIWALLAATRGSRAGLITGLIFSLLLAFAFGLMTILVFCRPAGCAAWPVGNIIVWVALISGLAASIGLGLQLRRR
jgi:uncharacterized membrane protein (DUF4010 family)